MVGAFEFRNDLADDRDWPTAHRSGWDIARLLQRLTVHPHALVTHQSLVEARTGETWPAIHQFLRLNANRLTLYGPTAVQHQSVGAYQYQGCYTDSPTTRVLLHASTADGSLHQHNAWTAVRRRDSAQAPDMP